MKPLGRAQGDTSERIDPWRSCNGQIPRPGAHCGHHWRQHCPTFRSSLESRVPGDHHRPQPHARL